MAKAPTDDDYQRLFAFRTGLRQFLRWSEAQAQASGVTAAQHELLLAIRGSDTESGPSVSELSETLQLKHHSLVGLLDRAEAAGLVRRKRDRLDRRMVRVSLTPRGRSILDRLSVAHLDHLGELAPSFRALVRHIDQRGTSGRR